VRLEADKLCLTGDDRARADGRKELVALADGFRESSESWTDLLRDCRRRGMAAPVLAVGDGAPGFWKAFCSRSMTTRPSTGHGVQADRVGPNPVASRQRAPPGAGW